jgi:hypothetical protein
MKTVPILENTAPSRSVAHDAHYFRRHPGKKSYIRSATAEEREQLDLPKGTKVVVVKLGKQKHARMFQTPDAGRN